MRKINTMLSVPTGLAVFLLAVGSVSAENESVSTIRANEAGEVHLTLDSANRVVEVMVKDCELCQKQSYLPKREIEVSYGTNVLGRNEYSAISGKAGTIVFDDRNDMVFKVQYWLPREERNLQ